ncbi:hypothetical protein EV667_2951 [Ancylobacter aquaticus]|uniref:Uncharacterized protein n=1 Tax=Ancylobacter aquaticus TaxID=100 RepID=A0A4V2PJK8_ANCAQ|nr:hypothetical protein [Ancylobacter aquaticus]TCK28936.1 hypothetical protein EV667_2951 [Ancylobacter aquaticus]
MPPLGTFTLRAGLLLAFLAIGAVGAHSADACRTAYRTVEWSKLKRLLAANGIPESERSFLSAGAEKRLKELTKSDLNVRGAHCGIEQVRTLVLGCLNSTLEPALQAVPIDRVSREGLWGRPGISVRAGVFIGMFHACRAGAMNAFLNH